MKKQEEINKNSNKIYYIMFLVVMFVAGYIFAEHCDNAEMKNIANFIYTNSSRIMMILLTIMMAATTIAIFLGVSGIIPRENLRICMIIGIIIMILDAACWLAIELIKRYPL